ncbi:helix-turn-helix domain-containing protein [Pseudoalteromonas piscicida]|uniref:Uncharacterized protein n=1 Tax=Pseudoalteromonas piscicida TaxID=43662 RepID=A0A2A5JQJ0_PSEO7|nr:helix-turn-helix domain-containing protein [Pseudoalteromonas piscicida]PCK31660.1 hypothetical protein CEX98_11100 [Pseudoalteromonas piscicida]
MDSNSALKRNLQFLLAHRGLNNASLASLSTNAGYDLTKSYVGKILKNKEHSNISLSKVDGIAAVLNVTPMALINPLGFSSDGTPHDSAINLTILSQCIVEARSISAEVGIDNPEFEARVIALYYQAQLTGDTEQLHTSLLKLVREF